MYIYIYSEMTYDLTLGMLYIYVYIRKYLYVHVYIYICNYTTISYLSVHTVCYGKSPSAIALKPVITCLFHDS